MSVPFKIEVDEDEVMPELLEQCRALGVPPCILLSALVEDVLIRARDVGLQLNLPELGPAPTLN